MSREVRIIHLVSGVELIAEVIETSYADIDIPNLSVKSPFCVYVHVDNMSGNQTVRVSPWSIATWKANPDKVYYLNKNLILMVSKAPEDIEAMYIKNTTGIALASEEEKRLICG